MTDQVSISTAPQGSGLTATAKASSGGKGTGFLGMLMSAIGRKPAGEMGSVSGLVHTGKNTTKTAGKGLLLIDATGNGKKHAAAKTQAKANAAASLIDATASNGKKHAAAKAQAKANAAASLIDATASTDKKHAAAHGESGAAASLIDTVAQGTKDKASAASIADQGLANKHDGHKHQNKNTSPSPEAAAIAVAMQQVTTPGQAEASSDHQGTGNDSPKIPQHAGLKPANDTALNAATVHPSLSSKGEAGVADATTPALAQDGAGVAEQASAQAKAVQPHASALPTKAEKGQSTPASGQTEAAVTAAMLADANGQPTTEPHIQGRQSKARGMAEDSAKASSQRGDAQTTAAAQQAKHAISGLTGAHDKDQAHTNADAHPGTSHASDTQNAQATAAASSKPGIHSYARVAAHTMAQATPTTALSHQALPMADGHHDAAMAQASAPGQPGQNPAMGAAPLTAAFGVGQSQAMTPTPQMTAPQVPVHTSGPWTVMAAMTEIGQAVATGVTRLELKLEPAHLGKVHVRIDSDHRKNIQVHLVVEQPNSRQVIEQQLPSLRHALEQQGLNLGNFSMSNQGQGGGQGSEQPGQQTATASAPGFNAPQAQMPQMTNTPSDPAVSGRLSIRI